MTKISWVGLLGFGLFTGCGADAGSRHIDATGTVTFSVKSIPTGVQCLRVTVSGQTQNVERRFDVSVGQSAVFRLQNLRPGTDAFAAFAYDEACGTVAESSVPTWLGGPESAAVSAGRVTEVTVAMHRNAGSANVSVDFPDASAPPNGDAAAPEGGHGITALGCADGSREAFTDAAIFPAIAACAGGWDGSAGPAYSGVFPPPLRTDDANCKNNGNSGPNPDGTGCSSSDLCESGWHLCAAGEIIARVGGAVGSSETDGCSATTWPENSLFLGAIGSTGCYICAEPDGTVTGSACNVSDCAVGCLPSPDLNNDAFGCGTAGAPATSCGDVDRGIVNTGLGSSWNLGPDDLHEGQNISHDPNAAGAGGGVLCCKEI